MLTNPIDYHIYQDESQELPLPKFYSYVLAGDGLFKWASTNHFDASICIAPAAVAGLANWCEACGEASAELRRTLSRADVRLKAPKIPAVWLHTVLDHARKAGSGDQVLRPIEQMYHFHFIDDRWRVALPKQDASAGRVGYKGGDAPTIVLDLHSHHTMDAYFSPTDNRDEQGCRFYAVIGNIYTRPAIAFRLGVWGDFVKLPATTLFEDLGPFTDILEIEIDYENEDRPHPETA